MSTPDFVHTDTKEAVSSAETLDESLPNPSQALAPETRPVQIATVSADDMVHGDFNGVVSAESFADSSHALAPETPADGKEAVSSTETLDECLAREVCVDQYLWSVYQRAPKQDTIKVVERRKVIVKVDGKARTIIKEFTTLVDEDFTWKDPKAAEKAGMSLMEYVIGGMDRDFKLKLYHALRAMDDAGLSPGITSAFRDDYRQSLASGLKAATDRSYHGGSFRGGYGHGLAADLVSVKGETRAERLTSSESLWKWIDAHGKEFGIGRPYLDKDPAHCSADRRAPHGSMSWRQASTRRRKASAGASNLEQAFRKWCSLFAIGRWNRERERNGRMPPLNFASMIQRGIGFLIGREGRFATTATHGREACSAVHAWPAVAATECPWRLLPRCRNGTSTNAKAVKAADERMSKVRLS